MKSILIAIYIICSSINTIAQLPEFEVRDLDQNWIHLSDLNGEELTVIDFWATWCKPCVSAIPKLNALYVEFSNQGVEFVGINVDGPRNHSKVKPFVNTLNIKYPIVLDPDQDLVNEYNVTAFPTLIVVNSKGNELFVHEGFNPGDEKMIRDKLIKLLENETKN